MKHYENSFDEYIKSYIKNPLILQIKEQIDINNININSIDNFNSVILYGPPGIGKYTLALYMIHKLSPSELKYEKKMIMTYNKNNYYFKISDIH